MNPSFRPPYQVIWKRSAIEIQLGGIVLALRERGESPEPVTRAMNRLDALLALDPNNLGESRPDFERIATEGPLTVRFAVHDDERLVYVLAARYIVPRSKRG